MKRAEDIEILRRHTCADEASLIRQSRQDKAMSEFIENTLSSLETIFSSNLPTQRSEKRENFCNTHIQRPTLPDYPTNEEIRDNLKKNVLETECSFGTSRLDSPRQVPQPPRQQELIPEQCDPEQ
jgi:hypothetical protein